MVNNPKMQMIDVAPLNVQIMSTELQEQEDK
jgi:hypothetical protein